MTRVLPVDRDHPDPATIAEAARVIRSGGLVAFPTETVYGLGADATNAEAVLRIYEAKGRPATNPLIVHGHEIGAVRPAVSVWNRTSAKLASTFWPGPLTLVLPRSDLIPDAVTAGQNTVGIRVPDSVVACDLFRGFGGLVAAPSANRSTGVSPTTAAHVLKDLDGRVDLIVDAGPCPVGIESTVLDLTSEPPRLLRPGAITADQIGRVLCTEIAMPLALQSQVGSSPTSPGQAEVHYAPRARLKVVERDHVPTAPVGGPWRYGLIVAGHDVARIPGVFDQRVDWTDPTAASRELYATLHRWDDESLDLILVVLPPDDDAWRAVRDRLWRASRQWASEGRR